MSVPSSSEATVEEDKYRITTEEDEEPIDVYEYETQFFGFTPMSFIDGVITAVNDYVFDVVDALQKNLLKRGCPEEQVTKELNQVLNKIQTEVDRNFDAFDMYCLNNILKIPEKVVIPSDQSQGAQYSEEEEREIDLEIIELENRLKAVAYANRTLDAESKELDSQMERLEIYDNKLTEIKKSLQHNDVNALHEQILYSSESSAKLANRLDDIMNQDAPFCAHGKENLEQVFETQREKIGIVPSLQVFDRI